MQSPNPAILLELINTAIPFGKYKGTLYYRLPVSYLEWFNRSGFPAGRTGMLLSTLYEIKLNGLEFLLEEIRKRQQGN
jgi:uncharacterized protein (DUF3820 family)